MIKRIASILLMTVIANFAIAQEVAMADTFRSEGKIYVVVGVIVILLIGLFAYMFRIERKVKKLEEK